MKKSLKIILLVILILVVLGSLGYLLFWNKDNGQVIQKIGKITIEKDGWKEYSSDEFGASFRFQTEINEPNIIESRNHITWQENLPNGNLDPYVYMYKISYNKPLDNKKYDSFEKYLNDNWNWTDYTNSKLISIDKFKNNNDLEYFKVVFETTGASYPNSDIKTVNNVAYYFEVPDDENHEYFMLRDIEQEKILQQIINSFKIIN